MYGAGAQRGEERQLKGPAGPYLVAVLEGLYVRRTRHVEEVRALPHCGVQGVREATRVYVAVPGTGCY